MSFRAKVEELIKGTKYEVVGLDPWNVLVVKGGSTKPIETDVIFFDIPITGHINTDGENFIKIYTVEQVRRNQFNAYRFRGSYLKGSKIIRLLKED
jgi:hypothetical protein